MRDSWGVATTWGDTREKRGATARRRGRKGGRRVRIKSEGGIRSGGRRGGSR